MSNPDSVDGKAWRRRCGIWLAGGGALFAVIGATGRVPETEAPVREGYSLITVGASGRGDAAEGYVSVRMHRPVNQQERPREELSPEDITGEGRRWNANRDFSPSPSPAMLGEQANPDDAAETGRNGLFDSNRKTGFDSLDDVHTPKSDRSLGRGWLTEGTQRQGGDREPGGISEKRALSPMESSLKKDLFPDGTPGMSAMPASSGERGGFTWRPFDDAMKP